jgi:hypothetical protein
VRAHSIAELEPGSPLRLFDDITREDDDGADYGEPKFTYLNRSGRIEVARVRDVLEGSFANYPAAHQADIRGRFRKRSERHHLGALSELVWHELLHRHDCAVEPHPTLDGSTKRPEFLAEEPSGSRLFLESVVDTTRDVKAEGKRQIERNLYDSINKLVQSPNFWVGIALRGPLPQQPSLKRTAAEVRAWLDTLNMEAVTVAWEGQGGRLPTKTFTGPGFTLTCDAFPKGPKARGRLERGIGAIWHRAVRMPSEESVRNALREKATRYGRLDFPYVIAVNIVCEYHQRVDILDVLFGSRIVRTTMTGGGAPLTVNCRASDQLWSGPGDGKNNGVSAVLAVTRLDGFTLAKAKALLVHNPWARHPYAGLLDRLPHARIGMDGKLLSLDGESLGSLLGLSAEWPED